MEDWLCKLQADDCILQKLGASVSQTVNGICSSSRPLTITIRQLSRNNRIARSSSDFLEDIARLKMFTHDPHPNIIHMSDYWFDPSSMVSGVAVEASVTDLKKFLIAHSHKVSPALAQSFCRQLVTGVAHMHRLNLTHGNLEPRNLQLCVQEFSLVLKIGDVVNSKYYRGPLDPEFIMAYSYRGPELFAAPRVKVTAIIHSDMWSVGCVMWELCTGDIAFGGVSVQEVADMIVRRLGPPHNQQGKFWAEFTLGDGHDSTAPIGSTTAGEGQEMLASGVELAQQCLMWDPSDRAAARHCEIDPFCQEPSSESALLLRPPAVPAAAQALALAAAAALAAASPPAVAAEPALAVAAAAAESVLVKRQKGSRLRFWPPRQVPDGSSSSHDRQEFRATRLPCGSHVSRLLQLADAQGPETAAALLICQCPGNCQNNHKKGTPCKRLGLTPEQPSTHALILCIECCCQLAGCFQPRFRRMFCFSHSYLHLGTEITMIYQASQEGMLQKLVPRDVQTFLSIRDLFWEDEALLFIAAWIMEPIAIVALGSCCPKPSLYSAHELSSCLQEVVWATLAEPQHPKHRLQHSKRNSDRQA